MTREELEEAVAAGEDLTDANLGGVDMPRAILAYASLEGAILTYASLEGAILTGAILTYANLTGADLTSADLTDARLRDANLNRANLNRAKLNDANLDNANLTNAVLTDADLTSANLRGANLSGAKLRGANLLFANLRSAILFGADLHGADMRGADMRDADMRGASLVAVEFDDNTIWPDNFKPPAVETTATRSYGRKSAALLKLRKPETPRAARDFKRLYPSEFEALKAGTQGRDFSDDVIARLRQKHESPFEWLVTTGEYEDSAQRLCPDANDVFKFNVNTRDAQYTPRQQKILERVSTISQRSRHPYEMKPLFTIGWVRYCADDAAKTWLVEEVQSDVQGVRKGVEDAGARRQLEAGGISPEDITETLDLLKPYTDRFYEDALGIVFDLASQKGYRVEMLTYADKRAYNSPMAVYTDLPKSMGMRTGKGSAVLSGLAETWQITPNRRRHTSRRTSRR